MAKEPWFTVARRMRIVTWNLWHGLSPTEKWWFEELEPQGRRELRRELQEQTLKELNADIYLFQEVNPVRSRSRRLARNLDCSEHHQADAKGLKVLNIGFPLNLNSGLSILHSKKLKCLDVQVTNLSGSSPLLNDLASLQWEENRVLIATTLEAPNGALIVVANTHFHHGLELTDKLKDSLTGVPEEVRGELFQRLRRGDERRKEELEMAIGEIKRLKQKADLLIFAGDLNFSPGTENYKELQGIGFVDLWGKLRPEDEGFTFDSVKNPSNHHFLERFRLPLEVDDLTFQPEMKESMNKALREADSRPRRIDYMWANADKIDAFKKIDMFGFENLNCVAPSDHFGLVADFEIEGLL